MSPCEPTGRLCTSLHLRPFEGWASWASVSAIVQDGSEGHCQVSLPDSTCASVILQHVSFRNTKLVSVVLV